MHVRCKAGGSLTDNKALLGEEGRAREVEATDKGLKSRGRDIILLQYLFGELCISSS
jgi:hypothetical protein